MVALLVVAALTVAAWVSDRPPSLGSASADGIDFSAERAWVHLERIATEPSPTGSEGNRRVRSYLVEQLEDLGLDVEVAEGVGAWTFRSHSEVGRVANVVGRLPGSDPTGRVILVAHYDTVVHSPGASDNKGPVAALLEVARVLTESPPLRNEVTFLFSDGEEPGLLGAAFFASMPEEVAQGGVVLNWEGYGNTGPSVLFQTSDGNAGLIEAFSRWVPHPVGDSGVAELFQFGSNNTDFTALRESGFIGLDISWIDGIAHYDDFTDTIENLNPASLQHHGESMLALVRGLGDSNLSTIDTGHSVTYFSVFGTVVSYPERWVWPLALAGIIAVAAVAAMARFRGEATLPKLLVGTGLMTIPLVAAPLVAVAMWQLLAALRPQYALLKLGDVGDTYRPGAFKVALVLLTFSVVVGWFLLWRRRIGALALGTGAVAVAALLGLAAAGPMPGLAYLGSLPALAGSAGLLAGMALYHRHQVWATVAVASAVTPGIMLTSLIGRAALATLGIAGGYGAAGCFALTGLAGMPLIAVALGGWPSRPTSPRPAWIPTLGFGLAVLLIGAGLIVDGFDEHRLERAHLVYLFDADNNTAVWVSEDATPHPWAAPLLPDEVRENPVSFPLPYRSQVRWAGPAVAADLQPPELTVTEHSIGADGAELRLHLRSPRQADLVVLQVGDLVREVSVSVGGKVTAVPPPRFREDTGDLEWPYELRFYNPPPEGFEVTLWIQRAELPRLAVSDITFGLAGLEGFTPRPPGLAPRSHVSIVSDSVVVGRSY